MGNKTLHIQFSTLDGLVEDLENAIKTGKPDQYVGQDVRFESYSQFMNYLFPHKFTLLVAIKADRPTSVYQLAKLVNRHQNAVLKDCDDLKSMGFIDYEVGGDRNSKMPKLAFDYDTILVHDSRITQTFQFSDVA